MKNLKTFWNRIRTISWFHYVNHCHLNPSSLCWETRHQHVNLFSLLGTASKPEIINSYGGQLVAFIGANLLHLQYLFVYWQIHNFLKDHFQTFPRDRVVLDRQILTAKRIFFTSHSENKLRSSILIKRSRAPQPKYRYQMMSDSLSCQSLNRDGEELGWHNVYGITGLAIKEEQN